MSSSKKPTKDQDGPALVIPPDPTEEKTPLKKGTSTSESSKGPENLIPTIQQNISKEVKKTESEKKKVRNLADMVNQQLLDKRKGLVRIGTGVKSLNDWKDENLQLKDYIDICQYTKGTEGFRVDLCKYAMKNLTTSVSAKGVTAILMCAWGLFSTEDPGQRVFKTNRMTRKGTQYNDMDATTLTGDIEPGTFVYTPEEWTPVKFEREVCYLCAAILRLATKDHENIIRAKNALKKSYSNFYQEDMQMEAELSVDCLAKIRDLLQNRLLIKNTLALFLLEFPTLEGNDRGLCRMLFELHLSYTGMHAYNLLMYCAERSGTPIHVMCALLDHPSNVRALDLAAHLMTKYEFPENDKEKKLIESESSTWRYARLFDPEVFADLQTKNTIMLTSILALIVQRIGTTGAGDVTKIRQVANTIERNHETYNAIADRACRYIASAAWAPKESVAGIFKDDEDL